ncbi:MAG: dUTP diphosphatase [Coprobacillus sp.]|nr:dUTP diphosphatase [Coprobacillus sp.]
MEINKINLDNLFSLQSDLDKEIMVNHNVTYESTRVKRELALLDEVGELMNSTRSFKFWSLKGSESKERVLDEYSDGLHFLLSLGLTFNVSSHEFSYFDYNLEINDMFLKVYNDVIDFIRKEDEESYQNAFTSFLSLIYPLGFNIDELIEAYYKKMNVNHIRQQTNY